MTSEGSSSHLHRCVSPHLMPEEWSPFAATHLKLLEERTAQTFTPNSLLNSLHLLAFFTLYIPSWSPPQVLRLHQKLWNFQGSKSARILRPSRMVSGSERKTNGPPSPLVAYPQNSNMRKRRWDKDAQQPTSDWLVGWSEKKQGVSWVQVTSFERAKKSAEPEMWTWKWQGGWGGKI